MSDKINQPSAGEAARILGVETVVFLDHEDGTLEPTMELRRELTRARAAAAACLQ